MIPHNSGANIIKLHKWQGVDVLIGKKGQDIGVWSQSNKSIFCAVSRKHILASNTLTVSTVYLCRRPHGCHTQVIGADISPVILWIGSIECNSGDSCPDAIEAVDIRTLSCHPSPKELGDEKDECCLHREGEREGPRARRQTSTEQMKEIPTGMIYVTEIGRNRYKFCIRGQRVCPRRASPDTDTPFSQNENKENFVWLEARAS